MENSPVYIRKLDQINSLIRDLYDFDSSDYDRYVHYLKELQEIIYFDFGNVVFFWKDGDNYNLEFFCQIGWPQEVEDLYLTKYYREDDVFPIFSRKTPVIMKSSDMFDDSRNFSQYYQAFMDLAEFDRSLECNIILPMDVNLYGICSLFRTKNKQDFVLDEEKVLEIIQPHLSNATTTGRKNKNIPKSDMTKNSKIASSLTFKDNGEILAVDERLKEVFHSYDSSYNIREIIKHIIERVGKKDKPEYCFSLPNTSLIIEVMFNLEDKSIFNCLIYDMKALSKVCIKDTQIRYNLTERETEIMDYALRGINRQEIADIMHISVPTVKKYISSIYRKMNINSHAQLMQKIGII